MKDQNQDFQNQKSEKQARKSAEEREAPNLKDAKDLGYTDRSGHAVSMAREDREGRPTGAYTDIGEGRSSAVRTHKEIEEEDRRNANSKSSDSSRRNSQEDSREQNVDQGMED